jgi:acetyltransferase-like isoleucine patch superfamily enzyme
MALAFCSACLRFAFHKFNRMTPQSLLISLPAMLTAQSSHNQASERWSRINELLAKTLIGWIPSKPGMLLRRLLYRPMLKSIGQAVNIDRGCEFLGSQRICVGDGTFISHGVYLGSWIK